MMPILIILLMFSTSYGFLLEKNTTSGISLTDQHYIYLLGLLTQEKANVQQMEQLMLKLNNEVKLLQQVKGNGSPQEITDLKNGYSALQKELIQVKQEISQVKNDNAMLRGEIYTCNNETSKLKTELETFTHSIYTGKLTNITQMQSSVESMAHKMDKTTTQLNMLASSSNARSQDFQALLIQTRDAQHKIESLKHKMDTTNIQLNMLTSSSNARNQDFLALLNQTRDAQHKVTILDSETKQRFQNYQNSSNQTIKALETQTKQTMQDYKNRTIKKITTLETDFHGFKSSTNQKINDAFQRITAINQTVVLTSCADTGSVSSGSVVKFPNTKTIYGVSDVDAFKSSGKFACEVPGVYLFSVFINSRSDPSDYIMYKNNNGLSYVTIIDGSNNGNNGHTGTGIMAVSLNVGDTVYVTSNKDMYVWGGYSCMTIIQIR